MSFKETVISTLLEAAGWEKGVAASTIRQCVDMVAAIPDEEQKECCAAPNYEAMYAKAQEEILRLNNELGCCQEVIRGLRSQNERLTGFREAVQMMTEGPAERHLQ